MELNIINFDSKKALEPLTIADEIFARAFNEPLIHQVLVAYKAAARSGNHAQKTRSAVRGGGAKPFRQKGMGRARAGTTRGPIWRTGGVTFAAKPADYSQKVNKKMYKGAICSILSELIRQQRLMVVNDFALTSHKTAELIVKLAKHDLDNVLIITQSVDDNLYLASRNLYHVDVRDVVAIDPVSLVGYQKVVITADALKQLEETLG